jgi:hypothetical protein
MFRTRRPTAILLLMLTFVSTSGCALLHELQPHRMWRWNRGPNYYGDDALFSVSDRTAEREIEPLDEPQSSESTPAQEPGRLINSSAP